MTKRFTAFLLAFIMIFGLVGCTGGEGAETTAPEAIDTTEEITEKVEVPVELTADILKDYIVCRPEKVKNESIDVTVEAAKNLKNTLNETFGVDLQLSDDWYKAADGLPETAKEILVGKTNRTETANVLAQIKAKDFAIAFENERIVITAGTDSGVADAVNYFIENYINAADKKIVLNENHLEIVAYQYPMGSISIAGTPITEYKIVYPKAGDLVTYYTALAISDYLYDNAGVQLEVIDDSKAETQYELLLGNTNRAASNIGIDLGTDKYSLSANGTKIVLQGDHRMVAGAAGDNAFGLFLIAEHGNLVTGTTKLERAGSLEIFGLEIQGEILGEAIGSCQGGGTDDIFQNQRSMENLVNGQHNSISFQKGILKIIPLKRKKYNNELV